MFLHLFRYRLKCLLRNRINMFWTLVFPLFLATAFQLGFGQLLNNGSVADPKPAVVEDNAAYGENASLQQITGGIPKSIPVAVVDDAGYWGNASLQQLLTLLGQSGEGQLLKLALVSESEADSLLEQEQVAGVIQVDAEGPVLKVARSGLNQSVLKAILDEHQQTTRTVTNLFEQYPQAAPALLAQVLQRVSFTVETSFSDADPNVMLNYFYALIAMTCLSGCYWGLQNSVHTQANLSPHGMRRSVAPTAKSLIVLTDTAAALLITFGEVLVLLAYLAGVFGIGFGSQLGFILLVSLIGSLNGVALGTFVGTVFRHSESVKTAMLSGFTITLSFLAGLMFANMKDIVMQQAPLLAYVNPAALITDAFYSLYIFSNHQRFFLNIGLLAALTVLFCLGSFICLRSERYASI